MGVFGLPINLGVEILAGGNIGRLRQVRGLELGDLARLTGMTSERLRGIEAGQPGLLHLDDMDRLASAFDISPASLFLTPGNNPATGLIKI